MKVVCLAGDGIGPEIMREAKRALAALELPGLEVEDELFGGAAIRATGAPLPPRTLAACLAADAVLKAPVGDPEFDAADVRSEQGARTGSSSTPASTTRDRWSGSCGTASSSRACAAAG